MNKESVKKLSAVSVYIISFVFFCAIMLLCPKVNDDYSFLSYGLTNIKDMFHFALYYGNGRLLGNLTSLLLILSQPAFAIQKAVILFFTVFLFADLFKKNGDKDNTLFLFLSALILIIGTSPYIFSEIMPWSTCFQNYVPPVTGLLLSLCLIKKDTTPKNEAILSVIIFITAFASQLFVEINTVVNILLSALITVLFVITKEDKSKIIKSALFTAGSVIGGAAMFLIPRIFVDPENQALMNEYRQFNTDSIGELISTIYKRSADITFEISYCTILLLFISICITLIMRNSKKSKSYKLFCSIGSISFSIFSISIGSVIDSELHVRRGLFVLPYYTLLAIFILSLFMCILSMEKGYEKNFSIISFFFVFISAAPITIVSPVGKRCFLLYYLFIAACGIGLAAYLINRKLVNVEVKGILAICVCVLCFRIGINYNSIRNMNYIQIKCIETQIDEGKEIIEVPRISNKYYHNTYPPMWGYYYYRNEPCDTTFISVDFEEYYEILK